MTPAQIIAGIESLSSADKETLAIMADKKLSQEIMGRRKEAIDEFEKGTLLAEHQLFVRKR